MVVADLSTHDPGMALGLISPRHPPRSVVPPVRPRAMADIAVWVAFAIAAVMFVLDATTTIAVIGMRPDAVEQNPIARWTLSAHPVAPYLLKAAVIAECAVVCALARSMGERWAAWAVVGLMALTGVFGIASGVAALHA
jgi:hypothetical protein